MIGVDFDNTIVCYDRLIHRAARERNLIPPHVSQGKASVRDYLRAGGMERQWTELQGYVYGAGMQYAEPFPGVLEFFEQCHELAVPVSIISHRSRYPFLGPMYDLHQAARQWLERHGFYDQQRIGLTPDQIFFELTKGGKLERIARTGCKYFIDDLPEFLAEPEFPSQVRRILFDPNRHCATCAGIHRCGSWPEIEELVVQWAARE